MGLTSLAATNFVPSDDEATLYQSLLTTSNLCVQLTPLSVEVYMYPSLCKAINSVQSDDEATLYQFLPVSVTRSRGAHVTPLSVEVYTY